MQVSLFVRKNICYDFKSCFKYLLYFYEVSEDICMDTWSLCFRFPLGTQQQVCRYIQQFKEIFTEDWRKSVKITHRVRTYSSSYISDDIFMFGDCDFR